MGKLDGKVAVITGGSSGMALAGAKLFVDEVAHAFISRVGGSKALDEAVKLIGRNVTGVQADSADLDDLDRLFDAVRQEKGAIDVLWTSAGTAEERKLGEITENHFDATFGLSSAGHQETNDVDRLGVELRGMAARRSAPGSELIHPMKTARFTGNPSYSVPPYSSRYAAAHRSRCSRGAVLIAGIAVA